MACPRCVLYQTHRLASRNVSITSRRTFHASSSRQRLGAATYQQEWQTGAYHYNMQTTKNHPVAAQTINKLLEAYVTMQRPTATTVQARRTAIASRRRGMEKIFVSGTTAKDYGHKVVVDAYVYDAAEALRKEREEKKAAMIAARKAQATQGANAGANANQRRRRGPMRRGRPPGSPGMPSGPGSLSRFRKGPASRPATTIPRRTSPPVINLPRRASPSATKG